LRDWKRRRTPLAQADPVLRGMVLIPVIIFGLLLLIAKRH
jgi:hypothetical protein